MGKKGVTEWDSTNEFEFNAMASSLVFKPDSKPKPLPAVNRGESTSRADSTKREPMVFTTSVEFGLPTVHERKNTEASKRRRTQNDSESTAMMKNELLVYSSTTAWTYTRRAALLVFFICYIIIFALAISLLVNAPCQSTDNWYATGIGYQILPRSFKDSDGDGIGDLNGVKEKLGYLKGIGVSIIWLGSVLKTPYKDLGYDVSNFVMVDPVIGTAEDFTNLVNEIHKQGMYLILEIPPNQSSDEHEWFTDSMSSRTSQFSDYYIWTNGVNGGPPNNWISVYGGPAWTYVPVRNQWYYHTFSEYEPDLNYRNPEVEREMTEAIRYWLSQDVDGLYLRHVNALFESSELNQDEPENPDYLKYDNETKILKSYDELSHIYTRDQTQVYGVLKRWRDVMQEYETITEDGDDDVRKLMVVDVRGSSVAETIKYSTEGWADYAFNYALYDSIDGNYLASQIEEWMREKPTGSVTSWSIGSGDYHRIQSRYPISMAMMTLLLTLPGSPVIYYGDEIGMKDIHVTHNISRDPQISNINETFRGLIYNLSRDASRSPMQWSSNANAGFSDVNDPESLWLPVNTDYTTVNTQVRNSAYLKSIRDLVALRSTRTFKEDQVRMLRAQKDVVTYARERLGYPTYFVAVNLADFSVLDKYYLHDSDLFGEDEIGTVVFNTHGDIGQSVDIRELMLEADQAIIVEFPI
ncbi:alpha-glucosidase-like [Antedon mediterranea]|uniref:alpha-glucosidase-like n=1 Tax=Antedon mediterranea TaxID=105859 RepID=UPI003AF9C00E